MAPRAALAAARSPPLRTPNSQRLCLPPCLRLCGRRRARVRLAHRLPRWRAHRAGERFHHCLCLPRRLPLHSRLSLPGRLRARHRLLRCVR